MKKISINLMNQDKFDNVLAQKIISGEYAIDFSRTNIEFIVQNHKTQIQRMAIAAVLFLKNSLGKFDIYLLNKDLVGGRAHDQNSLISMPVYDYKIILGNMHYKILREYFNESRNIDDSCGFYEGLFSNLVLNLFINKGYTPKKYEKLKKFIYSKYFINAVISIDTLVNGSKIQQTIVTEAPYISTCEDDGKSIHVEAGKIMILEDMSLYSPEWNIENISLGNIAFNSTNSFECAIYDNEASENSQRTYLYTKKYNSKNNLVFHMDSIFFR